MLTNFEILNLVKSESKDPKNQDLNTLDFEILKHLKVNSDQKSDLISTFLKEIESLSLNRLEQLHLINHKPKSLVELSVLIEEYDDRFTEKHSQFLLDLINKYL